MIDHIMRDSIFIPAQAELAPHLMRGIQGSKILVPCLRRDGVWIPAGVHPVLNTGRE